MRWDQAGGAAAAAGAGGRPVWLSTRRQVGPLCTAVYSRVNAEAAHCSARQLKRGKILGRVCEPCGAFESCRLHGAEFTCRRGYGRSGWLFEKTLRATVSGTARRSIGRPIGCSAESAAGPQPGDDALPVCRPPGARAAPPRAGVGRGMCPDEAAFWGLSAGRQHALAGDASSCTTFKQRPKCLNWQAFPSRPSHALSPVSL